MVPADPAAAVKDAKQAARAKGRKHLGKPPPPLHVPPVELQGTAAQPLVDLFPTWEKGLARLRNIIETDPGQLRGQGAKKLPLRFSRATCELAAKGLNWLLDLMLSKDPRAPQGFKYNLYDFERDDGESDVPLFQKVASMGEPGSSQGLGVWGDDFVKGMSPCAAGAGPQRAMMRLASFGASKRSPAFRDGSFGDADLLAAMMALWPLIAFGGHRSTPNRRSASEQDGHQGACILQRRLGHVA